MHPLDEQIFDETRQYIRTDSGGRNRAILFIARAILAGLLAIASAITSLKENK